jgi:tetratricopeptide (TPR) repeat protein
MPGKFQEIDDLLERNEIKKAEIALARFLRSDITDDERALVLTYRARARLRSARPDDAIEDLASARNLDPNRFDLPEMLELLADCYLARFELASVGFADRQDTITAQSILVDILKRFPDYMNRGWINYQLGRIALTNNETDVAEDFFHQALLTPSWMPALTAYCYDRLGFIAFYEKRDLVAAIGFLDKAIHTYPATEKPAWLVQIHILRSRVLREQQQFKAALAAAEQAVVIATQNSADRRSSRAEALLTAGELLISVGGRERDAISYLQQFLQISKKPLGVDVTWSRVHEMLGDAFSQIEQYDQAIEAYEAALQYNPYHPWEISLHYRIAHSFYQQNNYDGAVTAIERLLSAAAAGDEKIQDYRIYDVLASAQFALGRYKQAVASYRLALDTAPAKAQGLDKIRKYYQFAQELQ